MHHEPGTLTVTDEQLVAETNERFYRALSEGDVDAMAAVWLHAEWVDCVHPGWPVLHGWHAVRGSWEGIFKNGTRVSVSATDVRVRVAGEIAWVSCLERVATWGPDHLDTALAQATNVFVRRAAEWRLVVHHASPVPVEAPTLWTAPESVN